MESTQNYANHPYRATLWLVTAFLAAIAFVIMVLFVMRQLSVFTIGLLILATTVMLLVWVVRRFALRLQDRIIRLEMRLRLAALGREHDMARLAKRQLVALRFASDAELPALIDRTLSDNLTPDQIKRAVTNWQADTMRT